MVCTFVPVFFDRVPIVSIFASMKSYSLCRFCRLNRQVPDSQTREFKPQRDFALEPLVARGCKRDNNQEPKSGAQVCPLHRHRNFFGFWQASRRLPSYGFCSGRTIALTAPEPTTIQRLSLHSN